MVTPIRQPDPLTALLTDAFVDADAAFLASLDTTKQLHEREAALKIQVGQVRRRVALMEAGWQADGLTLLLSDGSTRECKNERDREAALAQRRSQPDAERLARELLNAEIELAGVQRDINQQTELRALYRRRMDDATARTLLEARGGLRGGAVTAMGTEKIYLTPLRRRVLEVVRDRGPLYAAEIAAIVSVTDAGLHDVLQRLTEARLLRVHTERRAIQYRDGFTRPRNLLIFTLTEAGREAIEGQAIARAG